MIKTPGGFAPRMLLMAEAAFMASITPDGINVSRRPLVDVLASVAGFCRATRPIGGWGSLGRPAIRRCPYVKMDASGLGIARSATSHRSSGGVTRSPRCCRVAWFRPSRRHSYSQHHLEAAQQSGPVLHNREVTPVSTIRQVEKGPDWGNSTGAQFSAGDL